MKKTTIVAAALAIAMAAAPMTTHASKPVRAGPRVQGHRQQGQGANLSDFKGKWVVLEWHNEGCPYVRSITAAATCRSCRRNGRRRAWSGSPSSRRRRASRAAGRPRRPDRALRTAERRAVCHPARPVRRDRAPLRRQDDAAHVRDQPGGPAGVQRRDRRQADQRSRPTWRPPPTTCRRHSPRAWPAKP
ncbi:MAG: hypothetical protein M0C28_23330 [Candidatus Moduliflexus flocculans]|nr:hypothetical protein [Candidatus Moduliflexus flocculans]